MKLLGILFVISVVLMVAFAKSLSMNHVLKIYEITHADTGETTKVATEALYIPLTLKDCSNSACDYVCRMLGYNHGACISSTTCHCTN
ncbi:uncharacterized protein LOC124632479 [Helicoverpa zea]|uniref:uncharacterized protein LOC124632479 n=1 Tax=Helicoverpa zea TaxID=7113 RepID=UPI001F5990A3|nr:uncharacterized protein LOC124632479 [Helicoverpa zea]